MIGNYRALDSVFFIGRQKVEGLPDELPVALCATCWSEFLADVWSMADG